MSQIGIHYAYWTHSWDADFHPLIDKANSLGFDILEVNPATVIGMSTKDRTWLRQHASDKNITLTFCASLPQKYDLASPDASIRKAGIAYLQQMAKVVGEIGGMKIGGIIYGCWPGVLNEGLVDKRPYVDRSISSMKEAAKAAEDNQVYFCLEVVNRFEQYILNICSEAVEYVDVVCSPNVKIMLDTFHMNIEEDFIWKAIELAGNKLGHFHIGENNRMPPGYGHIPWTEVGAALRRIGYDDTVVMEPFIMPGGEVGRDIKIFRDMSRGMNMDEEASKALMFVRGWLK